MTAHPVTGPNGERWVQVTLTVDVDPAWHGYNWHYTEIEQRVQSAVIRSAGLDLVDDEETTVASHPFRPGDRVIDRICGPGVVVTWSQLWNAHNRRPYKTDGTRVPVKFDDPKIGYAHSAATPLLREVRRG
jgi:hypothetical protein